MSNNNNIDPEKLKQLQQLMAAHLQGKGGALPGGGNSLHPGAIPPGMMASMMPKVSKFSPKGMLIALLTGMQSAVKFVDQFTHFIVHRKTKDANDVVDSAKSPILFGTYVTVIFVIIGFIWAGTAPLDSAAVASGTLISNTQRKTLNHQEGGIIKAIYVKVGDHVKKDDRLIEFDSTRTKADYDIILHQYRTFLATEMRLLAEINAQDNIEYPEFLLKDKDIPEVAKIMETQENLFKSKKNWVKSEQDSHQQRIRQLKKQIEGYEAKKVSLIKTLEVTSERVKATRKLSDQGFAQKATLLELEAKEAAAQSEIAMTDAEIARLEQEITKIDIDLLNMESKMMANNLSELKDAQISVAERREKLNTYTDMLERVVLRSPVDGIVNNLNYYTIGSVIPPGNPIIDISPSEDHLVIEAKVEPKNIDSIKVGLQSKIRFSAFKSRTTPLFTGTVISISPDIVIDQRQMDPRYAGGYYLARIELNMEEFNEVARTRKLELHPGMQAEVQIVTGTRTLLRYLLDPVFDAMFKGFKEK